MRDRSGRVESRLRVVVAFATATRSSRTNMAIGGVMPAGTRCRCADLRLIRHMKQRCQRRIARRMQWKSSTRARNHLESHQEMPQLDLRLRSRRDARTGVGTLGSGQQREGDTLSPAQSTFGTNTMATGTRVSTATTSACSSMRRTASMWALRPLGPPYLHLCIAGGTASCRLSK